MNCEKKIYCGIDVSKKHLDAFIDGQSVRYDNTLKGIRCLAQRVGDRHCVFESTGGYERLAAWTLLAGGKTASIVNPGRVRDYAKSMGQLAKTDPIDSQMITRYAEAASPKASELPPKDQRMLSVLVDRRQQLIDMSLAESNRLETAGELTLRRLIEKHLKWLRKQLTEVEEQVAQLIKNNPEMAEKAGRIRSIKGVWGPFVRLRFSGTFRSSERCLDKKPPHWPDLLPTTETAAHSGGVDTSAADESACEPACIWRPSARSSTTQS